MEKLKILVVDDDESNREVVAEMLFELVNSEVMVAVNGQRALALVNLCYFDLLITDRQMPGMFGEELISRAKNIRPAMKAVLMTGGNVTSNDKLVVKAAGTDAILKKPFLMEDLEKILKELFVL